MLKTFNKLLCKWLIKHVVLELQRTHKHALQWHGLAKAFGRVTFNHGQFLSNTNVSLKYFTVRPLIV